MKIITPLSSSRLNTLSCLPLLALSLFTFLYASPTRNLDAAKVITDHQTTQRVILKAGAAGIEFVIASLQAKTGLQITLLRSMSDHAYVVNVKGRHSDPNLKQSIDELIDKGLLTYAQYDSPLKLSTAARHQRNTATAMPPDLVPNDQLYQRQWILDSPESTVASVNMTQAWEITTGSPEVVVAVIDTGILFDHSDLTNRLLMGYDFVAGLNEAPETIIPVQSQDNYLKAHDGDGRDLDPTDPGDGVDLAFQDYMKSLGFDCPLANSTWHGTAMASLLAANGNDGVGMTGVDWQAKVLPVRAIGRCGGNRSDLLDAIRWAAGVEDPNLPPNPNPARIINLSLGIDDVCGPADQIAINDAVRAGAIIVAAVGNHGRNTDDVPSAPADCRHVIGVSAINADGSRAKYSNYGDDADIAAPGGDLGFGEERKVLVATNEGVTQPIPGSTHRYTTGTSVAAPLVCTVSDAQC